MRVTLDCALTFSASDIGTDTLARLEEALSMPNPEYAAALRRGRKPWGIPKVLCALDRNGDTVRVPRGAASILRALMAGAGAPLTFDDRRFRCEAALSCQADVGLREYQRVAVQALAKRQQGVVVLPAGSGKTRTALGCIAALATTTLILVSALDLARQWIDDIQKVLGLEAGMVGGGSDRVLPITLATVQTLARWEDERLDALLASFGMLVIDEAHHVPSTTFSRIVDRSPSRYRLALTATPDREDGLGRLLEWYVGPVLATVSHAELIAAGALVAPEIRRLDSSFEYEYSGPDDWQPMLDALWRDEQRNGLIVRAAVAAVEQGHSVLVLTGRVQHAKMLAEYIATSGASAAALTGAVHEEATSAAPRRRARRYDFGDRRHLACRRRARHPAAVTRGAGLPCEGCGPHRAADRAHHAAPRR